MLSLSIPPEVKLVAVTKGQPIEKIQTVITQGINNFGENYLQEAIPKINYFKNNKNLEWHFIGNIQSNKTKLISHYFDWVQSITHKDIATKLNQYRPANSTPLNICIEIKNNTEFLYELINHIQTLPRLKLRGLMSMKNYEKTAKIFYDLKKQGYTIDTLSMGMSQDYQQAIKLGATMVRIGTLLFGERKS